MHRRSFLAMVPGAVAIGPVLTLGFPIREVEVRGLPRYAVRFAILRRRFGCTERDPMIPIFVSRMGVHEPVVRIVAPMPDDVVVRLRRADLCSFETDARFRESSKCSVEVICTVDYFYHQRSEE